MGLPIRVVRRALTSRSAMPRLVHDGTQSTNLSLVESVRHDCAKEYKRQHPAKNCGDLQGRGHFSFGRRAVLNLLNAIGAATSPAVYDGRLSVTNVLMEQGATWSQVGGGRQKWTRAERVQFLVQQQAPAPGSTPTCLIVPPGPWGKHFRPITQACVDSCAAIPPKEDEEGEEDGEEDLRYHTDLAHILTRRIIKLFDDDRDGIICGNFSAPQPLGRYLNQADIIGMWNASRGFCATCSTEIWLADLECWRDRASHCLKRKNTAPPIAQQATVQRACNHIIHLADNCARVMVCRVCNSCSNSNDKNGTEPARNPSSRTVPSMLEEQLKKLRAREQELLRHIASLQGAVAGGVPGGVPAPATSSAATAPAPATTAPAAGPAAFSSEAIAAAIAATNSRHESDISYVDGVD